MKLSGVIHVISVIVGFVGVALFVVLGGVPLRSQADAARTVGFPPIVRSGDALIAAWTAREGE